MNDVTPAPAEDAAAKLAKIRTVLDSFEWGEDDTQHALEKVDAIVYGDSPAGDSPAGSPS